MVAVKLYLEKKIISNLYVQKNSSFLKLSKYFKSIFLTLFAKVFAGGNESISRENFLEILL